MTGKKAVLVMVLFDNSLYNFNFTGGVGFMGILYFSTNVKSIK